MSLGRATTRARKEYREAVSFKIGSRKGYAEVPCPKRLRYAERVVAAAGDRKAKARHDHRRLMNKIRILKLIGKDRPALEDASTAAKLVWDTFQVYSEKLTAARNIRNWARRSCKRKRKS